MSFGMLLTILNGEAPLLHKTDFTVGILRARKLLRPSQVAAQKFKRPYTVNGMGAVEKLDLGAVPDAHLVVKPAYGGIFMGDPFIHADHVIVAPFHHEGPRRD